MLLLHAILTEARWLAGEGVKELILVAQDPTAYGEDWGKPGAVCELLDKLNTIEGIRWTVCCTPTRSVSPMNSSQPLCATIRLCRISICPSSTAMTEVLKNMNRRGGRKEIEDAIRRLRAAIPNIHAAAPP